jgi:hypothetical protein
MSNSDYPAGAAQDDKAPFNEGLKRKRPRIKRAAYKRYKFICDGCGSKYSSPLATPPPGIKWDDGHVCTPIPVKNE